MSLRPFLLPSLLLLSACASAPPPPPAHSDALWRLIERDCRGAEGPRGDCLQVDAAADRRDALVEDAHGDSQLYLIHITEPTRLLSNSYAVFCLTKKTITG